MESFSKFDTSEIEIGFAVSLGTLRQILRGLSIDGKRFWIACDPADAIENRTLTIGHGDPGCIDRLNTLYFDVPVLNEARPFAGADLLILLFDSSVISVLEPGLYVEGNRILQDPFTDMECFFQPIRQALIDRLRQE